MKVLLVNPPRENEIIANNPAFVEEERGCNPPLGLLYIAASLESDHQVMVIDAQVEKLDYVSLEQKIREFNPAIVGLTTMTMTLIDVVKTVEAVKKACENAKIMLGGPHVHLFPLESMRLKNIDYLVLGEGEETVKELLRHLDNKGKLREIPGLVFWDDQEIVNTGNPPFIKNVDSLPFPARHLVPYKEYSSILTGNNPVTTMFTSRGCPFQCSFCDRPHLGKNFRARSPENVVNELTACVKLGINNFLFYDDTFTVDKERVIAICREIGKRELKISWDIRTRVDTVNEEIIAALAKAGCRGIHYGVEAGTEKILKILNKGITFEQIKKAFALTKKYKIPILAYFMIGNPGETREDIRETFRFMKKLKPDYVHLTIFSPFPGTKLYARGLQEGIIRSGYWQEFAAHPRAGFQPPHWPENFTLEELKELLVEGYKKFYFKPENIIKNISKIRNVPELINKARIGLKLFRMK